MTKISIRIPDLERHFSSDVFKDYTERLLEMRKIVSRNLEVSPIERIPKLQGGIEIIDRVLELPDKMIKEYRARDDRLSLENIK